MMHPSMWQHLWWIFLKMITMNICRCRYQNFNELVTKRTFSISLPLTNCVIDFKTAARSIQKMISYSETTVKVKGPVNQQINTKSSDFTLSSSGLQRFQGWSCYGQSNLPTHDCNSDLIVPIIWSLLYTVYWWFCVTNTSCISNFCHNFVTHASYLNPTVQAQSLSKSCEYK